MIKALLLDLDGTLLDDSKALTAGSRGFYEAHRSSLGDKTFEAFRARWRPISGRHWARIVAGELSFEDQPRECMREVMGVQFSDAEADAAFEPFLQSYEEAWCCYDDVAEFMRQTKGLKKIAVTNGQRAAQRAKMQRTGLLADISDLVTPEDVGAWKPDPAMFHNALNQLGVAPNEAMMIGDDYEKDIAPALVMALQTFWIRRGVNDLSEALAVIRS